MSNTYRATSARGVALYGEEPFEAEFSATEEADHLSGGHLAIVPRSYKVLSRNFTAAKQGQTFEGAFPVEQEAALIQGGHIERADKPVSTTKKKDDA